MTSVATWLNSFFADFDFAILEFYHTLAEHAQPILNPISEFLAVIGDGALACFVLAAILILFPKTRKAGLCVLFAIGFGALITNVAVKNLVARPRPYVSEIAQFHRWWEAVGAHVESEFSFPSGHTTAAMSGVTGLCFCYVSKKKWWIFVSSALYVIIMGASRNYLMVHYPTDVIAGIIVGAISGGLAYLVALFFYKAIEENPDNKFCSFVLNAHVRDLFIKTI